MAKTLGMTGRAGMVGGEAAGPIDRAQLRRATLGLPALAREVLILFDRQAERLLAEIAETSDARRRREAAHGLKGAALGIGAGGVAEAAQAVERLADGAPELAAAMTRLEGRVAEARSEIGGILSGR